MATTSLKTKDPRTVLRVDPASALDSEVIKHLYTDENKAFLTTLFSKTYSFTASGSSAKPFPADINNGFLEMLMAGLKEFETNGCPVWSSITASGVGYQPRCLVMGSNGLIYQLRSSGDGKIDPVTDATHTHWQEFGEDFKFKQKASSPLDEVKVEKDEYLIYDGNIWLVLKNYTLPPAENPKDLPAIFAVVYDPTHNLELKKFMDNLKATVYPTGFTGKVIQLTGDDDLIPEDIAVGDILKQPDGTVEYLVTKLDGVTQTNAQFQIAGFGFKKSMKGIRDYYSTRTAVASTPEYFAGSGLQMLATGLQFRIVKCDLWIKYPNFYGNPDFTKDQSSSRLFETPEVIAELWLPVQDTECVYEYNARLGGDNSTQVQSSLPVTFKYDGSRYQSIVNQSSGITVYGDGKVTHVMCSKTSYITPTTPVSCYEVSLRIRKG